MNWVMTRRPWLFKSSLLSLKPFDGCTPVSKMVFAKELFWVQMHDLSIACVNEEMGTFIDNTIGEVKGCDIQSDGTTWGKVLRVLIKFDLLKPITRGRILNIKGLKTSVPPTYENLPRICFKCDMILHGQEHCNGEQNPHNKSSGQFRLWLKAETSTKTGK